MRALPWTPVGMVCCFLHWFAECVFSSLHFGLHTFFVICREFQVKEFQVCQGSFQDSQSLNIILGIFCSTVTNFGISNVNLVIISQRVIESRSWQSAGNSGKRC